MKQSTNILASLVFVCVCALLALQPVQAQHGVPLTLQGLDHMSIPSANSRAAGGISIGVKNDISLMFSNPATLLTADGIQLSVSGLQQSVYAKQDQEYGALQNYSDFHLLLLSLTGQMSVDTSKINTKLRTNKPVTQFDSLQRPFGADSLTMPGWSRKQSTTAPIQAFLAVPFTIADVKFVAGIGAAEYANMDWFYQNNNGLSPNVLDVATQGVISTSSLPDADSSVYRKGPPYIVHWYRSIQERSGSIYGYGGSIAAALTAKLSLGVSVMTLSGTTDDYEEHVGRGQMAFYANSIRLSQQGMTHRISTGTSKFSGMEYTVSGTYDSKHVRLGFSVKPPTVITRAFQGSTWSDSVAAVKKYDSRTDSVHVIATTTFNGEDKMELPWRGTVGVGIALRENLTVGIEYEIRAYTDAAYTNISGVSTHPWLSSTVIRCGLEYAPTTWLFLRTGVRQNAEVFQPATSALRGEVVRYPVYSLGAGLSFEGVRLNVAYEYSDMRYVDTWASAVHTNVRNTNIVAASIAYTLPWMIE
jgi:opacity protein-like surface antigen